MYIIRSIKNLPPSLRHAVVTIGNFDGIHQGHQSLMRTLRQWATELNNAPTLVVTFEPHPQKVLKRSPTPERITTLHNKARCIAENNMDGLYILRFTQHLASLSPEIFVQTVLVEDLAVRAVLVGENFRFGKGGAGNCTTLHALGKQFGFAVRCQPLLQNNTQTVSSTRIRELVKTRQFNEVATLLGRPFALEGRVVHGEQRGRTLGFPTANLLLADMLHPPPGVYIVEGRIHDQWLPAIANLGHNPTFGAGHLRLEVHLLAPCGDIYHQTLQVRFLQHLRDEKKFSTLSELRQQIANDVRQAQTYFHQSKTEQT
ncbi:MAG: bifunctional riboflavin kinase/FAD synthetase [Magnetococcus sp. YQC-3]